MQAATVHLVCALVLLTACGSDEHCPTGEGAIETIDGGKTDLDAMIYSSSPWGGPFADFKGGATLEFHHGLGVPPDLVMTYLSFTENGVNGSDTAENAGDTGNIECVDAEVIRLHNNGCADLFVRVVALSTAQGSGDVESCDDTQQ